LLSFLFLGQDVKTEIFNIFSFAVRDRINISDERALTEIVLHLTVGLAIAGLTCLSSSFVLLSSVVLAENALMNFCTYSVL
jgi:hypothetical protein